MELVTGFKGEAHISAENWADLNRGLAGDGSYVLPVGEQFRAELVTNNLLKIYDGCGIFQGRQVVIPAGQSDEITIENGSQGEKRIDIVGVRYVKDESSKIETTESVYVKGTPAESDPVAPTLEEGNIRAGDLAATWALYQLELDGLNVVSVTPLFETLRSGAEVAEELEALNSKRVKLWGGSASSGDTINLAESAYGYNWLVFLNNSDGIKATLPITPNMSTVRCAGTTMTINGNFGSFGVVGSLTNNGSTVVLTDVGYITHDSGADHSRVLARTVSEVYGFR